MVSKDRLFQGMIGCFAVFSMQNFYESGYEHEIRQGTASFSCIAVHRPYAQHGLSRSSFSTSFLSRLCLLLAL